ncbi:nucleotide exchange factor GrpE [candidate division WOR-3 bacterium]|uniref:Protein GrpE n=1 Tax=candidate division WOR-3 bacterium TaxID=2052148 RepID=A0A9D5K982_UNCW3|nr:nucleotide exchange factor GrpE [candidate division WOR-3 bacterium]MBD3364717.1 nucleotide exchange factor GrpE [candidate division WOR-3 bacterium]
MVKKGPVSKLAEELKEKEAEVQELKGLMLRKAAEFDNARKRWEKERESVKRYVTAVVVEDLLEVWDNFERALEVEYDGTVESFKKGIEIIFSQFRQALARHEVERYSCLGEDFDPARAEALGYSETSDESPGKVVKELKKGFMLGQTVLRPAQVIVSKESKRDESQEVNPEQQGG